MTWDFSPVWFYREALLRGLGITFLLTAVVCSAGTLLALVFAVGLASSRPWISWPVTAVTELLRSCPPLVLLLWAYYLLPATVGVAPSPFTTAAWVFTLNFAAFAGDVFRGALASIPAGTKDAAIALGMSRSALLRRVYLPEMLRRSFPALNALIVSMLKMSSIASVISVREATYATLLVISDRPRPFELYTALAVMYILAILPLVYLLRRLESSPLFALEPANQ